MEKRPPEPHPLSVSLQGKQVGVLVTRWHEAITHALHTAAAAHLQAQGISALVVQHVPGCFELPLAAKWLAARKDIDAVVALGCVIQGETPHFEYVCRACCDGLLQVSLHCSKPVGFGIITAHSVAQATARSHGPQNKGIEAAAAVLHMLALAAETAPHRTSIASCG